MPFVHAYSLGGDGAGGAGGLGGDGAGGFGGGAGAPAVTVTLIRVLLVMLIGAEVAPFSTGFGPLPPSTVMTIFDTPMGSVGVTCVSALAQRNCFALLRPAGASTGRLQRGRALQRREARRRHAYSRES